MKPLQNLWFRITNINEYIFCTWNPLSYDNGSNCLNYKDDQVTEIIVNEHQI